MQKRGALFPMQSRRPPPGARVYLLCRQAGKLCTRSHRIGTLVPPSICQELHVVNICGPVCCVLDLSRAAQSRYAQASSAAVNRQRIATTRAGLFRMQSRRRRWRDVQPVNAARPSMARRKPGRTDPCSENQRQTAQYMQRQSDYANSPRIALYRLCRIALYPPRATHCKSCMRPFQTF